MSIIASGAGQYGTLIIWVVILVAFMFFFMIRPQRKEQQRKKDMMSQMEPGDTVLTTSGFYGVVISVEDEDCIVEFGNNKNCRIPMKKSAIAEVEKASDGAAETTESK